MSPAESGERHTYLIGAEGSPLVKIGVAVDPAKRLATLQVGSPARLAILWTVLGDMERALHRSFSAYRVHGEWFDLTPLGDALTVVANAAGRLSNVSPVAQTNDPVRLDIKGHLATHAAGDWCDICDLWPHDPLPMADGWCERCMVHAKDHDDSTFTFSRRRLEFAA
ncbi:GIY-YIG nuclease family protein [Streptomyces sp. WAC01280]|uniref:GIY-YIG nuclease family protein n=1 Tax=Streptomyces sp. WAC01280 TaxID=2487424 RepID=UPI000F7890D2|nr:GIY-YIG nuclease family protein [Streptomyces sp. WAC01280]RSS59816.1 GIY-YIG nuclease family protein [Streptomyces sp. WAC01280]